MNHTHSHSHNNELKPRQYVPILLALFIVVLMVPFICGFPKRSPFFKGYDQTTTTTTGEPKPEMTANPSTAAIPTEDSKIFTEITTIAIFILVLMIMLAFALFILRQIAMLISFFLCSGWPYFSAQT